MVACERGLAETRMFGGLAMMVSGNMAVVVRGAGGLMVRVDPMEFERLQTEPGVQAAVMRGRPMRGWLTVGPSACATELDLSRWVNRGVTYARGLPAK